VQDRYLASNGQQPGDPEKASEILIGLAEKRTLLFICIWDGTHINVHRQTGGNDRRTRRVEVQPFQLIFNLFQYRYG
jgi:hypothetical protein